jgi:hypothetical protein
MPPFDESKFAQLPEVEIETRRMIFTDAKYLFLQVAEKSVKYS